MCFLFCGVIISDGFHQQTLTSSALIDTIWICRCSKPLSKGFHAAAGFQRKWTDPVPWDMFSKQHYHERRGEALGIISITNTYYSSEIGLCFGLLMAFLIERKSSFTPLHAALIILLFTHLTSVCYRSRKERDKDNFELSANHFIFFHFIFLFHHYISIVYMLQTPKQNVFK